MPEAISPRSLNGSVPSFSVIEISRIALVVQTWLHRMQSSSHQLILKIMTGVQSPSSSASNSAVWSTLVGQTRMYWSHLMQRRRNSSPATDPGGLIAYRLKFLRTPPESLVIEKKTTPNNPARSQPCQEQLTLAYLQIRNPAGPVRQEPEREGVVRAVVNAFHAAKAFAFPPVALRVVGPFATSQAEATVGAAHRTAVDPPEREPAEHAQKDR